MLLKLYVVFFRLKRKILLQLWMKKNIILVKELKETDNIEDIEKLATYDC